MYDPTYAPLKDAPKNPTIPIDGNVIHLTRHDPYGHIFLSLEHGELPEKYQGAYTNMTTAELDAKRYVSERDAAAKALNMEGKKRQK